MLMYNCTLPLLLMKNRRFIVNYNQEPIFASTEAVYQIRTRILKEIYVNVIFLLIFSEPKSAISFVQNYSSSIAQEFYHLTLCLCRLSIRTYNWILSDIIDCPSFPHFPQTSTNVTDATFTTGVAIQSTNDGVKSAIFEVSLNTDRSDLGKWHRLMALWK